MVLDYSIYPSLLVSLNNFDYEQIEEILYEKKPTGFFLQIKLAEIWKEILAYKRQQNGAIGSIRGKKYVTNEIGQIISNFSRGQSIIDEFAILANTLATQWALDNNIPVIYCNHQPTGVDAKSRTNQINNLAMGQIDKGKYNQLLGKPQYSTKAEGHLGFALPAYIHLTSPMKRYVDFVNLRLIKAATPPFPYNDPTLEHFAEQTNFAIKISSTMHHNQQQKHLKQISVPTDYLSFSDRELFKFIKNGEFDANLLLESFKHKIKTQTLKEKSTVAGLFLTKSKAISTELLNIIPDDEIVYTLNLAKDLLDEIQLEFIELENTQEQKKIQLNFNFESIEIETIGTGISKKNAKLEAVKSFFSKWLDNFN